MRNWLWPTDLTPGVKKVTPPADNFYALGSKLGGLLVVTSLLILRLAGAGSGLRGFLNSSDVPERHVPLGSQFQFT